MKKLFLILILFSSTAFGQMRLVGSLRVYTTLSTSPGGISAETSPFVVGSTEICSFSLNGTFVSLVDSVNGSYTSAIGPYVDATTGITIGLYYLSNSLAGAPRNTVTLTYTSGNIADLRCVDISGVSTATPVDSSMGQSNSGVIIPINTGSNLTPSVDGELIFSLMINKYTDSPPFSPGGGFISFTALSYGGDTASTSCLVFGTPSATNAPWNFSPSGDLTYFYESMIAFIPTTPSGIIGVYPSNCRLVEGGSGGGSGKNQIQPINE